MPGPLETILDWQYRGTGFDMHPHVKNRLVTIDNEHETMKAAMRLVSEVLDDLPPNQQQQGKINQIKALIEGW